MTEQNISNLNPELELLAASDLETEILLEPEDSNIEPELLKLVEIQAERLEGRQRRITAQVEIPRPVEQVWQVITNYEALADFIPNLARSKRLAHPTGGIRLEQVGTQRLLRFNFSARVVLDLTEKFLQEVSFQMVEGDFKAFSGCWRLEPMSTANSPTTKLYYSVCVTPKLAMPVALVEQRLRHDLPLNLLAMRQRVIHLFK